MKNLVNSSAFLAEIKKKRKHRAKRVKNQEKCSIFYSAALISGVEMRATPLYKYKVKKSSNAKQQQTEEITKQSFLSILFFCLDHKSRLW
jgi:hypothetical protein